MEVQSQEMLNIVLTHFQGGLGALEHAKLSPVECRKIFIREGLKKIMENSIIGGEGGGQQGSFSISNFFYFFCSKWSKNHF